MISVLLVILVVFFFLRNLRTTFIPSVAVPVSLIGTFGVMYLLGTTASTTFRLMALTISTGFVVDDAIVVIENITRYLEQGMAPFQAALKGRAGDRVHRTDHQFFADRRFHSAAADGRHCGPPVPRIRGDAFGGDLRFHGDLADDHAHDVRHLLKQHQEHGWLYRTSERFFTWNINLYGRTLSVALKYAPITLAILLGTIALNGYLFVRVPKGFFPQQDNGRMMGQITGDQDISFQDMDRIVREMVDIVDKDPGVDTVNGSTGGSGPGGGTANQARMFINLKPLQERKASVDQIIARLRPKLARIPGATLYMQASQDLRVGGRSSAALYQYTLLCDNLQDLTTYAPRMLAELKTIPIIADVNSDLQNRGLQSMVLRP
jgi:multidrug efflux pump